VVLVEVEVKVNVFEARFEPWGWVSARKVGGKRIPPASAEALYEPIA